MTKSKAYYQAYLVLDCLSNEEYSLIPKDLLAEIQSKMEIDDSIFVDKTVPLEDQKIDEKTYDILDRVIKAIERAYGEDAIDNPEKYANLEENPSITSTVKVDDDFEIEIDDMTGGKPERTYKPSEKLENKEKNEEKSLKEENIRLQNIIKALEIESKKVEEAKALYYDYKELVQKKDEAIRALQIENESLKSNNQALKENLEHIPRFFRKIFKVDKLLK